MVTMLRSLPTGLKAGLLGLVLAGCGGGASGGMQTPAPATDMAGRMDGMSMDHPAIERPIPYPVTESRGFARAVERGTRTRTGEPGPNYWQQSAKYRIRAELDPETQLVTGAETVWYYNRSPIRLAQLILHVRRNLFAPEAQRNQDVPITRAVAFDRIAANGQDLGPSSVQSREAGYGISGTIMRITLPEALQPGDSVALDFEWNYPVPPDGAPRSGFDGGAFYVAYWYPQMAVLDDMNGWNADRYLGSAEFYMGYGDYDVELTVPAGYLVTATGELQNPDDVLSPQTRERLERARHTRETVRVVTADDRAPGMSTTAGMDGKLTWHFKAQNVRDFAWSTSDQFLWDATSAIVGDATGDGAPDTTAIGAFYRPGEAEWENSARYAQHSVETLSQDLWPYPYPHMTAVDGPASCGGMEYPMMTCIGHGLFGDAVNMYSVLVHEIAHMWFPMIVGSNEKRHAWMDEGLTQFNESHGIELMFPETDDVANNRRGYLQIIPSGLEEDLMTGGDQFANGWAYGVASYSKPATILVTLRALLGEEMFTKAFREYGRRWAFKHPAPWDLWNTFDDVTGEDHDWFWRSWFFETWALDQALGEVTPVGDDLQVIIEDRGNLPMPVRLAVTRADGEVENMTVPVDVWLHGAARHTLRIPDGASVTRLEIDAAGDFPDVDRDNQVWTRQ